MERVESVVIGAGVVGLAIGRALALDRREVVVLEAAGAVGTHTSSRNNEVIHAGFAHPAGTLKTILCLDGRDRMYRYCAERGIPHRRIGKLVPATDEAELRILRTLRERAQKNGVEDIDLIDQHTAQHLEPELRCLAALHSPSTGIVDSHSLMLSLQADIEERGGTIACHTRVTGGRVSATGFELDVEIGADEALTFVCDILVNAAGHGAREVALRMEGIPRDGIPRTYMAKGSFFAQSGRPAFTRLIHPVGDTRTKGGALTLDLAGQGRFGPDFEWVDRVDYRVDPMRATGVAEAVRRYHPAFDEQTLQPGYAGIRPRLDGPDADPTDWSILGPAAHGITNLVNLFGIDSPGLTSSLAIGDYVLRLLR